MQIFIQTLPKAAFAGGLCNRGIFLLSENLLSGKEKGRNKVAIYNKRGQG